MIYIFWPGKAVPEWLERVESHDGNPPTLTHHGWGYVFQKSGVYMVYILIGGFMRIHGGTGLSTIQGGGRGVELHCVSQRFRLSIQCASAFIFGMYAVPHIVRWIE